VNKAVQIGMSKMSHVGITSVSHIVNDRLPIQAYKRLRSQGRLTVRIGILARIFESELDLNDIASLDLEENPGSWLRLNGLKISIDGYFPNGGAKFSEGYTDDPKYSGRYRILPNELNDIVDRANRSGFRMCLHANGDEAIDAALNSIERALHIFPRSDHRHRIEHFGNQYCTIRQMQRAISLGIVAVPNPPFIQKSAKHLARRLGPVRSAHPLPLRTMLDLGLAVGVGSDYLGLAPVDPLIGIATLVTRRALSGETYAPQEAISPWEALKLYTSSNSWVNFDERVKGRIAPGYLADFAHLSRDVLTAPVEELRAITVRRTMVGGSWVFDHAD
jgi:predicted amidohydrolase YtcJ